MNAKQQRMIYIVGSVLAILMSVLGLAMQAQSSSPIWVRLLISIPALLGFALGAAALPRHWQRYRQYK